MKRHCYNCAKLRGEYARWDDAIQCENFERKGYKETDVCGNHTCSHEVYPLFCDYTVLKNGDIPRVELIYKGSQMSYISFYSDKSNCFEVVDAINDYLDKKHSAQVVITPDPKVFHDYFEKTIGQYFANLRMVYTLDLVTLLTERNLRRGENEIEELSKQIGFVRNYDSLTEIPFCVYDKIRESDVFKN